MKNKNWKILRLEQLGSNILWLWLKKKISSAWLEHFAAQLLGTLAQSINHLIKVS